MSASLSGLAPATTYYYRLVAFNGVGAVTGAGGSFTTPAAPAGPPGGSGAPAGGVGPGLGSQPTI